MVPPMTYRDRLQLEDELKREFFGLLERHTMFRRLPVRKKEEMARAARLDEIFVRLARPQRGLSVRYSRVRLQMQYGAEPV